MVTGAAGFIGRHVVGTLAKQGHEVIAAIRPGGQSHWRIEAGRGARVSEFDLDDASSMRSAIRSASPEVVIHLAWYAAPGAYWTSPANLDCVGMSLGLARALADVGCRKLVAVGSCAEYDWSRGLLSEDRTPLAPRTLYGTCKNALRQMLETFCGGASMQFAWTRIFYLYGPAEKKERLVPSVICSLLGAEKARCSSGEQVRDFLYIEDAAAAIASVATSEFTGVVNIGSGQPTKVRTIVEQVARIIGCANEIAWGAIAENPAAPPFLVADVGRLNQEVGWKPSHSLEHGLALTVDWWRARCGRVV
jgi:nucleoside-diphosphate-sugar epimerase